MENKNLKLSAQVEKNYNSILNKTNLAESVGRPISTLGKGKYIWNDIKAKINLKNNTSLLDIGCGFGEVTQSMLEDLSTQNISLALIDTNETLQKIKDEFSSYIKTDVFFAPGYFPHNVDLFGTDKKYDNIISYSVIQYAESPEEFIESAVQLLAPGGKLLLGDFANVNKKGRFVSTPYGRKFDADYKNIPIESVPIYSDQYAFVETAINHINHINDELLFYIMKKYRNLGFEVYVLPQPAELPYSMTREDVLIVGQL